MEDPSTIAFTCLKNDLEKMVKEILGEKKAEASTMILASLKEFSIPDPFMCPISGHLMRDPAIIASGLTFERTYIQSWIGKGIESCPVTREALPHTAITPNIALRNMISEWCRKIGLNLPDPSHDDEEVDKVILNFLLDKLTSSGPDQLEAARNLRVAAKRKPFCAIFSKCGNVVPRLLSPLSPAADLTLQQHLLVVIYYISHLDYSNKSLVGGHPDALKIVVECFKQGRVETGAWAAEALSSLSHLDSNNFCIGEAGVMQPLIHMLQEGNMTFMMEEAFQLMHNLCAIQENKSKAVHSGLVRVAVNKINDRVLVDHFVSLLALVSSHHGVIEQMAGLGAVGCLLRVLEETDFQATKQHSVELLLSICENHGAALIEMAQEETKNKTISKVVSTGTESARITASLILNKITGNKSTLSSTAAQVL